MEGRRHDWELCPIHIRATRPPADQLSRSGNEPICEEEEKENGSEGKQERRFCSGYELTGLIRNDND
jgi:hypothetical protein